MLDAMSNVIDLAQRARAIAAQARAARAADAERHSSERAELAERAQRETPDLYRWAQEFRRTFGPGTRVRFVRWPDGRTWGSSVEEEGTAVIPAAPWPPEPRRGA